MEDQSRNPNTTTTASEPSRCRWTPKPEQIVILESIFNSGTVNPSKDDTVRIRHLLHKYGPVGDANVFYWFQNRRSRCRRRQRQLQAATTAINNSSGGGSSFLYNNNNNNNNIVNMEFAPNEAAAATAGVFSISGANPTFASPGGEGGGGIITVFVNGVATQIPAGSFDVKAVFGDDILLVHSTGIPVPVNHFGFSIHGLHHGETYFLVPRVA